MVVQSGSYIHTLALSLFLSAVTVVGLELTEFSVDEGVGTVEICAIVRQPAGLDCPIDFPFDVELFTEDRTAGITYTCTLAFADTDVSLADV